MPLLCITKKPVFWLKGIENHITIRYNNPRSQSKGNFGWFVTIRPPRKIVELIPCVLGAPTPGTFFLSPTIQQTGEIVKVKNLPQ